MRDRVAARHWILLGIIAQMPDMRIHVRLLTKLMYDHLSDARPGSTLKAMAVRGLIEQDGASEWIQLTEYGATRQRQTGRTEVIRFVRVPDKYIRAQAA